MAYERVNWENLPSKNTPVNADNLNKMDEGIANAVEKTGDTLTGELLFENKDIFTAIRKTRTLNNEDYQVTVGVGGNMSARMEFVKVPDNVLGSVEARSDGIYNGKTNKKLAEQSNGWTNVSLTSYLKGSARYVRIGNIVIVNFNEVRINQNITQHATVLVTGLPKASTDGLNFLTNYNTGAHLRIVITAAGNIQNHWSNANASDNVWYGTLIYITNE